MSEIEKRYEAYQNREDQVITIENRQYYRLVFSEVLRPENSDRKTLSVIPCPAMPIGEGFLYEDEKGNRFAFDGFHLIRFLEAVPTWYREAGECSLRPIETEEIGAYLTVIHGP